MAHSTDWKVHIHIHTRIHIHTGDEPINILWLLYYNDEDTTSSADTDDIDDYTLGE